MYTRPGKDNILNILKILKPRSRHIQIPEYTLFTDGTPMVPDMASYSNINKAWDTQGQG